MLLVTYMNRPMKVTEEGEEGVEDGVMGGAGCGQLSSNACAPSLSLVFPFISDRMLPLVLPPGT